MTKPASSLPSVTANGPTTTAYAPPTTTASAASITIPDLTGQNAKLAKHNLSDLGLTNVTLASANPEYKMVILPENWTVVSIEPAPGTSVSADDPVVVKVTKP